MSDSDRHFGAPEKSVLKMFGTRSAHLLQRGAELLAVESGDYFFAGDDYWALD